MHKPKILHSILLACSLQLTAGCFEMQSEIFIRPDGSGTATVGYAIMESFMRGGPFDEYLAPDGSGQLLDENALVKKINERPGLTVNKLDLWNRDGTQYVRTHVDFRHVDNLGDRNVDYTWRVEDGSWVFRILISKNRVKTPDSRVHQALMRGMADQGFHFKVHLPKRIVESNADSVHWNVAEFFVPVTFFFQNEISTRVLYARMEAGRWERFKAWLADLNPF